MSAAECPEDLDLLAALADERRERAKWEARARQLEAELNAALGRASSLEVQLATAHKCHAMTTDRWSADIANGMLSQEGFEALMGRTARHEAPPPDD